NGEPGVYAARFAGENCTYRDNRLKVLGLLENESNRGACFRTVVAFAEPGKLLGHVKGEVEGTITHKEFGESGFGYDPIFRLNATGKTFAEMPSAEKHGISHRSKALEACIPLLKDYFKI
ncbi:MAG: non-canonical purine NTP pyrophosphatase, partial [Candidatus Zophobacter franzmannii]|nr:non-canonical purine NTP pyrophosphatase [Candidatus Zophobacter franzmannii]